MVLEGWEVTRGIPVSGSFRVMSTTGLVSWEDRLAVQDSMGKSIEAEMSCPVTGLTDWFLIINWSR